MIDLKTLMCNNSLQHLLPNRNQKNILPDLQPPVIFEQDTSTSTPLQEIQVGVAGPSSRKPRSQWSESIDPELGTIWSIHAYLQNSFARRPTALAVGSSLNRLIKSASNESFDILNL